MNEVEEIFYSCFLAVLFSFLLYPVFQEVKHDTVVKKIIKKIEEELKKENKIDLETYSHLKEIYDMYIDVICIALILIYQRLYTSRDYNCNYPTIKGKELNPNGTPVKQADRSFGQFAGHHF